MTAVGWPLTPRGPVLRARVHDTDLRTALEASPLIREAEHLARSD